MGGESLGSNAEIIMGQSPPGETCNTLGKGLPLLNGPTEFGPYHPYPTQFSTEGRKESAEGDVLFCVRGSTTGRMNWSDQTYAIGRGIAAIRHKKSRTLQPLLRAVIEYNLPSLLAQATGSTFPNVSSSQLAGLPWPQLNPDEEEKAATIIGSLDDKIELNREMNETLEGMARAIFKSWFIDFDPVHAKAAGRQPVGMDPATAALFPDSFQPSPLGPIPKGWEVGALADIAEISKEALAPGSYPEELFHHYSIPAFDDGKLPKAELGESIKSNKTLVPSDSVLVSKLNPRIPRVWLPDTQNGYRSICSTEFVVLKPSGNGSRSFLYSLVTSSAFQIELESMVTGTSGSHQRVRPESMMGIKLTLPNKNLMDAFASAISPILAKISTNIRERQIVAFSRDALLPQLLSGELEIQK